MSLRAFAAGGADGSDMTDLDKSELAASMRSLYDRLPWYRRASARLGLQGKLVICFMSLLLIALGSSYWLFLRETRTRDIRTYQHQAA